MEKIIETKICKCWTSFEITDRDLEFYDKVSPVFNDVKYSIPSPKLCPDCRQQRRLVWRNERSLYKNTCHATGKNMISNYSPDKSFKIYEASEWWSDKWDALEYGRDFDFSRNFFPQFKELIGDVPKMSIINNTPENSDYCNQTTWMKNSYLTYNSVFSEDCFYSKWLSKCKDTMDCLKVYDSEQCYECIDSHNCSKSFYLRECIDCHDCYLLKDCVWCKNCLGCVWLRNAEYQIFNIKYSKEEFQNKIIDLKNIINDEKIIEEYRKLIEKIPHKYATIENSENCSWDNIYNSHNSQFCFDAVWWEELKFCYDVRIPTKTCYDCSIIWMNLELSYENCASWIWANHILFNDNCWQDVYEMYYSQFCIYASNNCFGCVGLKWKSYCILNKQYTQEEYNKLVPKIIEHMQSTWEWWEFFPASLSPFWYNETVASEYYPLNKEEAIKNEFNWCDYENPKPDVTKIIPASKLPSNISEIPDDIINWAIECEVTNKPFRIIKSELEFYRKHNLPIPHKHPDERHMDRMRLRNPRKLWDRKCDKCEIDIKTTYAPERKEIVYCEDCYNKEVI